MTCRIELTDPEAYGPDKPIRGRAVLQFVATEEFKVIKCIFKGTEKTEWVERHNSHNNRHYGENTLFYAEAIFAENGQLPPGQHTYPFVFNLPRNMASTYESSKGSIKYNLTLLVDKGIISNYTCEMAVQIKSPINFNSIKDQLQLQSTIYEDEKVLCCCCCKSSPVSIKLFFEKEAFVVGEVAKIRVNIVNMSDMSIPQVLIYLQQIIIYRSSMGFVTKQYNELGKGSVSGVGAHGDRSYLFNFEIPPSAEIPNFSGCLLFSSEAHFIAVAVIPGFHVNLRITTEPITLGHIPIDSSTPGTLQLEGEDSKLPPPYTLDENNDGKDVGQTELEKVPLMIKEVIATATSAPNEENIPSAPSQNEISNGRGNT